MNRDFGAVTIHRGWDCAGIAPRYVQMALDLMTKDSA